MLTPTQSEFEAFPPTLKRKCFSTLERLRYAQAAQAKATAQATAQQAALHHPTAPRNLITKHPRPDKPQHKLINSFAGHVGFLNRNPNRRSNLPLAGAEVSQEDALWFARLPEKVRRGQFTLEEQKLLAARQDPVILDAADERLYKLGAKVGNRSLPSLESSYSDQSSAYSFDTEYFDCEEDRADDDDMDSDMMNSFGWLDETDLDLTLDDYHIAVAETALPKKQPSSVQPSYHRHTSSGFGFISTFRASMDRKPSTRRPLEDWGSGWAPAQRPSLPRSISATETPKVRSHSVSQAPASPPSLPRASTQTDIGPVHLRQSSSMARASVESGATHYLNPEARLKLRYYLASPSKFDEALEFGFPSLQQPSTRRNSMSSSRRRSNSISSRAKHSKSTSNVSNTQGLTFLDDETTVPSINLSATEQRLDLDPSVSRLSSSDSDATDRNPITPQAPSFLSSPSAQTQMGQPQGWIDTELVKKDQHSEAQRDPYLQDSWGGREMTLRMTLTRPDLRADDSVLYPDAATHPQALRMSNSQRGRMGKGFGSMDRDTSKLDDFFFGDEKPIASKEMSGVRRFLSRKW